VYGDNAMSDGMVRKWVRMLNGGREHMHDEARSGRPSLVNDDLVLNVNERVRDDRRFTISDLSLHFPQISFYEEGIQKLVPRYDKSLNNGGEYVEK